MYRGLSNSQVTGPFVFRQKSVLSIVKAGLGEIFYFKINKFFVGKVKIDFTPLEIRIFIFLAFDFSDFLDF